MTEQSRLPEPNEAYALGALSAIFMQDDRVELDYSDGVDVTSRSIDVVGLVPIDRNGHRPVMRITIEEVQ